MHTFHFFFKYLLNNLGKFQRHEIYFFIFKQCQQLYLVYRCCFSEVFTYYILSNSKDFKKSLQRFLPMLQQNEFHPVYTFFHNILLNIIFIFHLMPHFTDFCRPIGIHGVLLQKEGEKINSPWHFRKMIKLLWILTGCPDWLLLAQLGFLGQLHLLGQCLWLSGLLVCSQSLALALLLVPVLLGVRQLAQALGSGPGQHVGGTHGLILWGGRMSRVWRRCRLVHKIYYMWSL